MLPTMPTTKITDKRVNGNRTAYSCAKNAGNPLLLNKWVILFIVLLDVAVDAVTFNYDEAAALYK